VLLIILLLLLLYIVLQRRQLVLPLYMLLLLHMLLLVLLQQLLGLLLLGSMLPHPCYQRNVSLTSNTFFQLLLHGFPIRPCKPLDQRYICLCTQEVLVWLLLQLLLQLLLLHVLAT
jgi:hypothetical protein